ncbi:metallophosphoesterase family protein [Ensifer aridi]|uniref:metallophosphoesterase family protein n=1 Tax=Ensifer aridi TaxID=1708715 RepID=UPI000A10AB90|nr:metallophosphoesterase [Ensifer aridi]
MKFSILHISDLHQNLKDEILPEVLLDTIANDFERYSYGDPIIPLPDLCVVSGDIVYGVGPTTKNSAGELERQYNQAYDFLVSLCDRFFAGDRDRLIVLPGNHDIDYPAVVGSGSFLPVPRNAASKSSLVAELFSPNSDLRWSWSKLEFFRVTDQAAYDGRLQQFAKFYERFYSGLRSYPLDPSSQFDIFDFPDLSFSLAAFNSCYRNDPMNRVGAIHPRALMEACRQLRSPSRAGWCLASSWHHDIAGGVGHEDFLDSGFIQHLIDAGVTIGFHGHQHRTDCFDQRNRLGDAPRKMTVIAAGTLCAGPTNLSPGIPRGFNIVEIDSSTAKGRVHSRQMINQLQSLPIWGPGLFVDSNKSFLDFDLSPPIQIRPSALDVQLILEQASDLFGHQKWKEVVELLEPIAQHPTARRFYVEALVELGDNALMIDHLREPSSTAEAVIVGAALLESDLRHEAQRFLGLEIVAVQSDPNLNEIKMRLSRRFAK